jgi:group I intron endonuclease
MTGIYCIQSKVKTERIYIGSSNDIDKRWYEHLRVLRLNKHHSIQLQRHFNKYGENDLIFTVIEPCMPAYLTIREQYFMDTLSPYFNSSISATSPLGVKRSDATKEKQRNLKLGIKQSNETIEKRCLKLRGRKMPDRFIEFLKNRVYTDEWKKKISVSHLGNKYGCRPYKPLSEEHKRKLSVSHKGKIPSDETRIKLSEAVKKSWIQRKLNKKANEDISNSGNS